jgi:hypothetical protein
MNPRIILLLVLAVGIQTLVTGPASAAGRPQARPTAGRMPGKPLPKKEPPKAEHTTVSSISAESITITEGGKAKTYKITKDTEIAVKGQKAKVEDIKSGMRVSVSMGSDPAVASRINASDAPKEDPKAGDKKK